MSTVAIERHENSIATVALNRPQALNALTWEAMQRFSESVTALENMQGLRAVVVYGTGGAFCSGGDLHELHQYPEHEDGARLAAVMGEALDRWARLPCPTIAAIEGPALGGGAELALACDLRVMAQDSTFGMMHLKLAITPAWGGGQRLLRLVGYARALEWLVSAKVLSAQDALEHGVANAVTRVGRALSEALRLAERIVRYDPDAVQAAKRLLRAGLHFSVGEALQMERDEFAPLWAGQAHHEASERFVSRKNERSQET